MEVSMSVKHFWWGLFPISERKIKKWKVKRNIPRLLHAINVEKELNVRKKALAALGEIKETSTLEKIFNLLGDSHESLFPVLKDVLIKFSPQSIPILINFLGDSNQNVRKRSYKILKEIGAPAVKALIQALDNDNTHICSYAARLLGEIAAPEAIEPLIKGLSNSSNKFRKICYTSIKSIGNSALQHLIERLDSESKIIRCDLVQLLGDIGDKKAFTSLIKELSNPDEKVRVAAIISLRKLGDEKAINPLIQTLADQHKSVVEAAINAIREYGSAANKPLIGSLENEDRNIRKMVVQLLGDLKVNMAIEPIRKILEMGDDDLCKTAINALGEIGGDQAIEAISKMLSKENDDVRKTATNTLVKIGIPAVSPLIDAMLDEPDIYRDIAFKIFNMIGHSAAEILIEKFKESGDERYYDYNLFKRIKSSSDLFKLALAFIRVGKYEIAFQFATLSENALPYYEHPPSASISDVEKYAELATDLACHFDADPRFSRYRLAQNVLTKANDILERKARRSDSGHAAYLAIVGEACINAARYHSDYSYFRNLGRELINEANRLWGSPPTRWRD
jgi:HEAT repeat protein